VSTFKRELRTDAIAKRVYERLIQQEYQRGVPAVFRPWDQMSEGERKRVTLAVEELIEEHVILPGWVLM
jgi:hypothetical protein